MGNSIAASLALLAISVPSMSRAQALAKPDLLLRESVKGMPKGEMQEIRVLTANLRPGDKTAFHTHRSPVTV
ncbi:MAG: hypothetical protein ACREO5_03470 [Candidatus Binatia bacterium]